MVPAKLLVGGTVAVGSTATAAVVANQYGLFSSSKVVNAQEEIEDTTKPVENVEEWFDKNIGKGKWKIKIKEKDSQAGERELKPEEGNPKGLLEYLNEKEELLKSLASTDTTTTFIFEYEDDYEDWGNVFTKEQITTWVKNSSGDKATLQVENFSDLNGEDLEGLFDSLSSEDNRNLFIDLGNATVENKKTILFEKNITGWKHSKTAIKKWGESSNFEIKIGRDKDNSKALDQTNEGDLVGLMDYLFSNEIQGKSTTYKKSEEKITWIFKKDTGWKLVYSPATINDWINNVSDKKAKLELCDGGTDKDLSQIDDEAELKQLFETIIEKENLFKKGLESHSATNQKTITLKKCESSWKCIKKEIQDWLSSTNGGNNEFTIKIQTSGGDRDLNQMDEDNLIGLLNYLKKETNKNTLLKLIKDKNPASLTFKKEGNNWDVVHSETTINNWVKNTFNNATLKLWDNGTTKPLSDVTSELKQLFRALKNNESKLTSLEPSTTIVFEKDKNRWKHIKEALNNLLISKTKKVKSGLTIKISKSGSASPIDDKSVKDEDLVGLYKFINESDDLEATKDVGFLVFKKDNDSWSRDKTQEKS